VNGRAWYVLAGLTVGLAVGALLAGLVLESHVTYTFLLGVLFGLALGAYLRWLGRQ
jgi:hypothetical protein